MDSQKVQSRISFNQSMPCKGPITSRKVSIVPAKKEKIPRLTLQPLVENAIYHGLKYKENWGSIYVDVQAKEESIFIKVADDGIGMTEEKLNCIRSFTQKAEKHFGLYSVNHRLLLYYGEKSNLQIESKYEEGTCITIEMPRGNYFDKNYDCG